MNLLYSIVSAFTLFSRIPMPHLKWDKSNMRYVLMVFPLVGVVTGALMFAWYMICTVLVFSDFFNVVGLLLIPIVITGGIHLDGYLDVCDALASHSDPSRSREILKDSNIGAFACIGLAVYLLAYIVVLSEINLTLTSVVLLCISQVLSRCMAAIASLSFPLSPKKGMLSEQAEPADRRVSIIVLLIIILIIVVAMAVIEPLCASGIIIGALIGFGVTYHIAIRRFEGMNGDLAGFLLQVSELLMATFLLVALKVVTLCF